MAFVRTSILEVKSLLSRLTKPVSAECRRAPIDKALKLNPRPTSESHARATIPLVSHPDKDFHLSYVNHEKHVRLGKLLEDLDMFAGWIAYRHNSDMEYSDGSSPLTIVTACVDSVEIYRPCISANQDLYMFGVVSWTGSSSMEITIHLTTDSSWQIQEYFEPGKHHNAILHSKFVMVARDHGADGKAAKVYPLDCTSDVEKAIFQKGIENKHRRIKGAKADLSFAPPTEEESARIHEMYLSKLDKASGSFTNFKKSTRDAPYILMKDTSLKSCILCQPEYKNVHNKIFGGFLMRQAIELGEANFSLVFHEAVPNCIEVADISFQAPVEIGSLLILNSKILLTEQRKAVIRVHAQVVRPTSKFESSPNLGRPSASRIAPESSATGRRSSKTSILDRTELTSRDSVFFTPQNSIGEETAADQNGSSRAEKMRSSYAVTRMEDETETTNVFYFVFESKTSFSLPEILPETYGESLLHIDGQRCLDKMYRRHADALEMNGLE